MIDIFVDATIGVTNEYQFGEVQDSLAYEVGIPSLCGARTYSVIMPSQLQDALTLDSASRTISITLSDGDLAGIHSLDLKVTLDSYPDVAEATVPFTIEIGPCEVQSMSYAFDASFELTYELFLGSVSIQLAELIIEPAACNFEVSSYSITANGSPAPWALLESLTSLTIVSSDMSLADQ